MPTRTLITTAVAVAAFAIPGGSAVANRSAQSGNFNFNYVASGEQRLQPLQVFDDGQNTYLQFRGQNKVIPAIMVDNGDVSYVATPQVHGPYVVVAGVNQKLVLGYNSLRAQVENTATARARPASDTASPSAHAATAAQASPSLVQARPAATLAISQPTVRPAPVYGAAAPSVGDGVETWSGTVAASNAPTVKVPFALSSSTLTREAQNIIQSALNQGVVVGASVIGREDAQLKEGVAAARAKAITDALVRHGVPRSSISVREGYLQEGEKPNRAFSDLVLRYAPKVRTASAVVAPGSIQDAIASIRTSLATLVRLGALSDPSASSMFDWLSRSLLSPSTPEPALRPSRSIETASSDADQWVMSAQDETMRQAFERWAQKAGYTVEWTAGYDIPVRSTVQFRGGFVSAVTAAVEQAKRRAPRTYLQIDGRRIVVGGEG